MPDNSTYKGKFPFAMVKRLMKEAYPGNISPEAIELMDKELHAGLVATTKKAAEIAAVAKRKTIFPEDIRVACKE
jgi:histone H3/H4